MEASRGQAGRKRLLSFLDAPRYPGRMDPALSPDQYRALREAVRKRMNYLHACRVRMYRLGAVEGDPLYDLFGQAERALQRLTDELHRRSISGPRRLWEPGGDGGQGG